MSPDPLNIYLNDHLAGATAGVNLAKKISSENAGSQFGDVMTELTAEIEADRTTVEELVDKLGLERSTLKEAAGWVAERLSRLKFAESLTGTAELKRMLELETLSLGIEGKRAMWRALQVRKDPRLVEADLDRLIKRAEEQRAIVELHRLEAASLAFRS